MNFKLNFIWSYYPLGVISNLRVENNTNPYIHTPRPEIEKYMNQDQWLENTLQEVEEKVIYTTITKTPTSQEKHDKRPREYLSSLVTEIQGKEFKIYKKRQNTSQTEESFQEENV